MIVPLTSPISEPSMAHNTIGHLTGQVDFSGEVVVTCRRIVVYCAVVAGDVRWTGVRLGPSQVAWKRR